MSIKNTYWNKEGKHQAEYNALTKALIPSHGSAQTLHGEHLRCASNIYYDRYNNGLGNNITSECNHLIAHLDGIASFCRDVSKVRDMLNVALVYSEQSRSIDEVDDCNCGWNEDSDESFECSCCRDDADEWHHDKALEDLMDAVIQLANDKAAA